MAGQGGGGAREAGDTARGVGPTLAFVETATDTVRGEPLMAWRDGYANETLYYVMMLPRNQYQLQYHATGC